MDFDITSVFLGGSDDVRRVLDLAQLYAQLAGPLLLLGPTGVGKGLLARLLHRMSGRPGDFVVRTGGQLVDSLFHAQLFGSRRGAFTGARDMPGAFEQANTGTLFLDELPLWSLAAQSAVLRAVDERVVLPLGGRGELGVTCGLVFASSRPLDVLVAEGRMLPDLRYRIKDFVIDIAPLTARRGDIAVLAYHFLDAERAKAPERPVPVLFSAEALARLLVYQWPGNVRQLAGAVEFACVHARGAERIEACHLPPYLCAGPVVSFGDLDAKLKGDLVAWARTRAHGRRREAAELLGVCPGTLDYHTRRAAGR